MKQSIGFCGFCDAFRDADRNEQFSYEGKRILFDYLEQYEEYTGEEIELDVIAICCEYSEQTTIEVYEQFFYDVCEEEKEEFKAFESDEQIRLIDEFLNQETSVCGEHNGVFVYAQF